MKDLKWLIVGIAFFVMALVYKDFLPAVPGALCICVWGEGNGFLTFKKRGAKKHKI